MDSDRKPSLTDHATKRAAARGISLPLIADALLHGSRRPARRGRVRVTYQRVVVVLAGATVVTVWRMRERPRKRRAG